MVDYPIKVTFEYEEKASRLELIVRIVYCIIVGIIASLWGIVVGIAVLLNWLHILILGRRHRGLWNFTASFYRFVVRFSGYLDVLTDKRPPISGEE